MTQPVPDGVSPQPPLPGPGTDGLCPASVGEVHQSSPSGINVLKARSTLSPRDSLMPMVLGLSPNSSAHAAMHCVLPLNVNMRLRRVFLACSLGVAQRVFPSS
jgi:hypothetical protein